jgi:iron complex outermembrane receptor protein
MMNLKRHGLLLVSTSLMALATPAFAQDAAPAPQAEASADATDTAQPSEPQAIVVTGSRTIKNGDSSPSPVTVVSTADALRVQPGTLADALNSLPVFAGSRGSASNPSSTGTAAGGNGSANQLNLRNLGVNRTLILMDGVRVPPTTYNGIVDVDIIPQTLVQRVDTVTGGVSAVYGSDAVAGVVNYILDKKLHGIRAFAQAGISQEGDNAKVDLGIAAGTSLFGGRGHIEFSYEYRDEKGILARSDRDFLDQVGVTGAGTAANPYKLGTDLHQSGFPFGGLISCGAACSLNGKTFGSDGVTRAFVPGTLTGTSAIQIGGDGGYYDSSLIAPLEAHQVFARFDYELTDHIRFYVQVSGDIKKNESFADYVKLSGSTFNSNNAFLAPAYRTALSAVAPTFKLSELVADLPRLDGLSQSKQFVYMGGFEGDLGKFNWGVNFVYGDTQLKTTLKTNINNQRLAASLDAVTDGSGNIVCNVTITNPGLYPGCVAINVFGANAVSPAAAAYVLQPTHYIATNRMDDVSGHIEGSPFATWAGDVNVALSGEWRKTSFASTSDALPSDTANCTGLRYNCIASGATATPLWAFTFGASPKVSQTVWETAIEATVPLVKDVPFIKSLEINGAARYTSYNTSGNYTTWKIGADWKVTDTLRFRGTRSRDIRAPTLFELYAPLTSVPVNPVDLLTGLSPSVPSVDQSNPNLKAEIANTLTGGVVWKPSRSFSVALDFYSIKVGGAIVQITGSTPALQQLCYASGGTSEWCAYQQRPINYTNTTAANAVTRWYTKYLNIGAIETAGADLEVNYNSQLFNRPLSLRVLAAYQPHVYYRQPNVVTTDQGGVAFGPIGLGAGPAWRINGLARFQPAEHVTLDIQERWRSAMKLGGDPSQVWVDNHINAFATTNVTLTFDAKGGFGDGEFFLNVQNLFNAAPPVGGYSGNGTRAGLRDGFALGDDVVGRYFTAGVRLKF